MKYDTRNIKLNKSLRPSEFSNMPRAEARATKEINDSRRS